MKISDILLQEQTDQDGVRTFTLLFFSQTRGKREQMVSLNCDTQTDTYEVANGLRRVAEYMVESARAHMN